MPAKIKDEEMVGRVFSDLTVLSREGNGDYWLCKCACGTEDVKYGKSLRKGDTKSCGCLKKKMIPPTPVTTHGMSKTKTYIVWRNMKARCDDVNHQAYENYGGRGISYDERWKHFENFYKDMGECPEGLTLDRTDVLKGYSKENCEWVDNLTQSMHRRKRTTESTSRYKGVCFKTAESKFVGTLNYEGKTYHLGYSHSEEVLAERYDKLLIELSGSDEGTNKKLGYL